MPQLTIITALGLVAWMFLGSAPATARDEDLRQRVTELQAQVARLQSEVSHLKSQVSKTAAKPETSAPLSPETRTLEPNGQGYWLKLNQAGVGTWSLACDPRDRALRFGPDSVFPNAQLRLQADGAIRTGQHMLDSVGQASPAGNYPSHDLIFRASIWDPATGAPADATNTLRLRPTGTGPHNNDLSLLDDAGFAWVTFLDFDVPGKEVYFRNADPGGALLLNLQNQVQAESGIRFFKSSIPNQWIIDIPGDQDTYKFAILRDWLFTAMLLDEDGRMLVGRLLPHPPANAPAAARFHVRGQVDETQAIVQANGKQTADIFQVLDGAGTTKHLVVADNGNVGIGAASPTHRLEVRGDIAVGSPQQPAAIRLYDTANGRSYRLQMTNGQLVPTPDSATSPGPEH